MKLKTPLTTKGLKNHLVYHGWQYLLAIALSFVLWNLVFIQTTYRPPQDKRIDLYIQSGTANQEAVDAFLLPIWQQTVPHEELVTATMMLQPGGIEDYYSSMQLLTYFAAAEGDIYMLTLEDFKRLAAQEAFVPLDDYIKDGRIKAEGIDLNPGRVTVVKMDEDGNTVKGADTFLFGIPAFDLYRFASQMNIDNRNMVLALAINGGNLEDSALFLNALIEAAKGPKPEFLP